MRADTRGPVTRPRLLIADDHILVVEGLRKILEGNFDLVGTAATGDKLLSLTIELLPDVVLLDITMPVMGGFETAREIRRKVPSAKLVFVTMHTGPKYISEAFRLGASAYVIKHSTAADLREAIHTALKGQVYVSPLGTAETQEESVHLAGCNPFGPYLTRREREVLKHIAEGHATKEIAYLLTLSSRTVEFHKQGIMRKLGLRTVAELTRYALRSGLLSG